MASTKSPMDEYAAIAAKVSPENMERLNNASRDAVLKVWRVAMEAADGIAALELELGFVDSDVGKPVLRLSQAQSFLTQANILAAIQNEPHAGPVEAMGFGRQAAQVFAITSRTMRRLAKETPLPPEPPEVAAVHAPRQ